MLKIIENKEIFKKNIDLRFNLIRKSHVEFNMFLMNLLVHGTCYIIGGFVRDTINGKESRDLDMITTINHELLLKFLNKSNLNFSINKMNGVKINLKKFEIDVWSIDNNWAFKESVVKRNDDYILDNISDGCFYNYDGLVYNVHSKNFRTNHYNDFVINNKLDIIQKSKIYKLKNPLTEANILRAIYLNTIYGVDISPNCLDYLVKSTNNISENYNIKERLNSYLSKYEKYNKILSIEDVMQNIQIFKYIHQNRIREREKPGQLNIDF